MKRFTSLLIFMILLVLPLSSVAQFVNQFCEIGTPPAKIKVPCPFGTTPGGGPAQKQTFGQLVVVTLDIVLLVIGGLTVVSLIWGGFRYITAYGNEEAAESAKRIIKHSILGLIIVVLAFAIVAIITNILVLGRVSGGP